MKSTFVLVVCTTKIQYNMWLFFYSRIFYVVHSIPKSFTYFSFTLFISFIRVLCLSFDHQPQKINRMKIYNFCIYFAFKLKFINKKKKTLETQSMQTKAEAQVLYHRKHECVPSQLMLRSIDFRKKKFK